MQRIVAGELRGRKLKSLPARVDGVRPSSARVRSAIFDRLQHEVRGARVLDLFAGSGALAIEALSRGAETATFVEIQPVLVEFLRGQLADLHLEDRVELHNADARSFLGRRPDAPFDLVLVDPPYAERSLYPEIAHALLAEGWLARGAVVVAEHERGDLITWPAGIVVDARRDHGSSVLEFLSRESAHVQ